MAITVEEKYGRRLAGNTHERTYIVRGTLDDEVAFTALLEQTPTERGELLRKDDEIELEEIEGVVSGAWLATVPYGVSDQGSGGGSQPQAGDSSFAFETRGGTQNADCFDIFHIATLNCLELHGYGNEGPQKPNFLIKCEMDVIVEFAIYPPQPTWLATRSSRFHELGLQPFAS